MAERVVAFPVTGRSPRGRPLAAVRADGPTSRLAPFDRDELLVSVARPFADPGVEIPPGAGGSTCARAVVDDDPLGDLAELELDGPPNPPLDTDGGAGGFSTPPPELLEPELELPPPDDAVEDPDDDDPLLEPELPDVRGIACAFNTTGAASASAVATVAARRTIDLNMGHSRGPNPEQASINFRFLMCKFTARTGRSQSFVFPPSFPPFDL